MAKTDIPKNEESWKKDWTDKLSPKILKNNVENILFNKLELELKIEYIDENPWYSDEMDFMFLWWDLSEKNIDSYLPQLLALNISTEKLNYIIEWIIYSNKSNISVYKKLIELNNEKI